MSRRDMPLFSSDDLISEADLAREAAPLARRREDLDSATMWRSREDGLLVRGVKPHSAQKSLMVSRGIDTVSTAMAGKWFATRYGVEYVELYSGPGRLLDESTGKEQLGSPLQALSVKRPFSRYVFSDVDDDCAAALAARIGGRDDVHVVTGDANDREHLERVIGRLNRHALVIVYLDPARPQDLRFETVRYLAEAFEYLDLIVNLPVNNLIRAIHGAYHGGGKGPGAAGRYLEHDRPHELLRPHPNRPITSATIAAIRDYYDERLMNLGFKKPARRTIFFPPGSPYYDVLRVPPPDRPRPLESHEPRARRSTAGVFRRHR